MESRRRASLVAVLHNAGVAEVDQEQRATNVHCLLVLALLRGFEMNRCTRVVLHTQQVLPVPVDECQDSGPWEMHAIS